MRRFEKSRGDDLFVDAHVKEKKLRQERPVEKSIHQDSEQPDSERSAIHPDVLAISDIVPAEIDAEAEYRNHLLRKHR